MHAVPGSRRIPSTLLLRGLAKKISVHDPALLASRLRANGFDVVPDIRQPSGYENLILRADIGAPIDVDARALDRLEGLLSVEHDDNGIDVVGKSFRQLPAGRDVDRFADAVERDPVFRRQRLDTADAGNHVIFDRDGALGFDLLDDPQGAVVQCRVAPDQERTAFSLAQLLRQQGLVALLDPGMPVLHAQFIVGTVEGARRRLEIDETIGPVPDVSLAYLQPQARKVFLLRALVGDEERVHSVECIDGLNGDVFRIAGTDADDENFSHRVAFPVARDEHNTPASTPGDGSLGGAVKLRLFGWKREWFRPPGMADRMPTFGAI